MKIGVALDRLRSASCGYRGSAMTGNREVCWADAIDFDGNSDGLGYGVSNSPVGFSVFLDYSPWARAMLFLIVELARLDR